MTAMLRIDLTIGRMNMRGRRVILNEFEALVDFQELANTAMVTMLPDAKDSSRYLADNLEDDQITFISDTGDTITMERVL